MTTGLHSQPYDQSNPYGGPTPAQLSPTLKQVRFAQKIATASGSVIPSDALSSRRVLSNWIDEHRWALDNPNRFAGYASSKQVAFAERIARVKRRTVPDECFRDRKLMSLWIDSNK